MKLKIRFLINTLGGGGAEKVLIDLLRCMDPARYELSLVTVLGGVREADVPEYVRFKKIVGCKHSFFRSLFTKLVYKMPPKLFARLFLKGEADIEIAYLEGSPVRFVAAKQGSAAKLAFVHCDISQENSIAPYYNSLDDCHREYASFTRVCFVSEQSRVGFESVVAPLPNACVVHNMVEFAMLQTRSAQEAPLHYEGTGLKLVTVGRLVKEKAFDRLLRVVSELEKRFDFELWIIGEGDEREHLEGMIREQQIRSARLLGYHKNPYVFMKQADLFICSSLSEGYGMAMLESVLLGVPVLATECAATAEILDQGALGMIVENSEEGLRQGLVRLLEDGELLREYRRQAMAKSQAFTNEQAMHEYTDLFEQVTKQKKGNRV
jgi:glycosyltransferase involved in cell wall biosynthesis